MTRSKQKFIVVTGGVLSGLGKGVTGASIGLLFSDDYKVCPVKLDGYLNSDPGTMNPIEHGEVFVLDDGFEVDMDFGHYERFIGGSAVKAQSITMGKVFQNIRVRERRGNFLGKTVQMIPHVTDLIQEKILKVCKEQKADIGLIEIGGTVGDIENDLFIEAMRQLRREVGEENVCYVHLTYIPIPYGVKEQKTKPTQQSVDLLNKKGIWPDFIIARCSDYLTENSKRKISLFTDVDSKDVLSAPDVESIYKLPQVLNEQGIAESISKKLKLKKPSKKKLELWDDLLSRPKKKKVKIAIAGKYTDLEDSYASVVEALNHCGYQLQCDVEIVWLDTENESPSQLKGVDGVIVPGGFGTRGVEGKINVIKYVREKKIPFLGICYGLQLAVVEYLRNVSGDTKVTTCEIDPTSEHQAISILDEQKKVVNLGGTMRLGAYEAFLKGGQIQKLYSQFGLCENGIVSERHRHRFEVNPEYVKTLESDGMIVSGISKERHLVEFIELPKRMHPYFVGTQAHPELKSKLEKPAPLFYGLVQAALKK